MIWSVKQEWTKPGFVQVTTSCSGDYLTEHFSLPNSLNMSGMAPPLLLLPSLSISGSNQAAPIHPFVLVLVLQTDSVASLVKNMMGFFVIHVTFVLV